MTHKLTKNDSMSKKCSQNCTTFSNQNPNLDVLVASFEAFLKRHKGHREYFNQWRNARTRNATENVFLEWREWAANRKCEGWINSAFEWMSTKQGLKYWIEMNHMWLIIIKLYHKK